MSVLNYSKKKKGLIATTTGAIMVLPKIAHRGKAGREQFLNAQIRGIWQRYGLSGTADHSNALNAPMSLIRACRGISIPSADVKGISGTGATVGSEDKEHPLTSSQPQMLISEADTQKCRLLPCGEQFPWGPGGIWVKGLVPCGVQGQSPLPCGAHPVDCVNLPRCYGLPFPSGVLNAPLEKGAGGRLPLNQYHSPLGKGTDVNICPLG